MGLREYIIKRAVFSFILILFVIVLNFMIFELMPGRVEEMFIRPGMRREQVDALIRLWELDQPAWTRFLKMVYNLLSGNFVNTYSYRSQQPISIEIGMRLLNTMILIGTSTVISMVLGILLGVISAHKRGGKLDNTLVLMSLATYSFPTFWMGMLFILVFSIQLHWFPSAHPYPTDWQSIYRDVGGFPPPAATIPIGGISIAIPSLTEIQGRVYHSILPVAVLTLFQYGGWLLLARASVLETITEDYVTTARAKGLKERTVLLKHVLKNASLPLITSAALSFGFMLSGAIITEGVFSYRGFGSWIWESVQYKDFPVLSAMFFIIALCVILANFLADILYGVIDPRIKYG
ncbi:ABC transporter permease [Candidatus Bathyarchaeota archaeon]|nr:ABC transporter permease [Candidatus Bathyarchaeota archaeon]